MKRAEMKPLKHVKKCETCRGVGKVWGAVQYVWCPSCIGLRYQSIYGSTTSAQSLSDELHATRVALAIAVDALNSGPLTTGPESAYYGNNGRGAGGSNFTGD